MMKSLFVRLDVSYKPHKFSYSDFLLVFTSSQICSSISFLASFSTSVYSLLLNLSYDGVGYRSQLCGKAKSLPLANHHVT